MGEKPTSVIFCLSEPRKLLLMLPRKCQSVLIDTALDDKDTRVQKASRVSVCSHFRGSRRSATRHLVNRTN